MSTSPPRPLVLGHRGASALAAGNTTEAFRLAADAGAEGVELDVRFTADGEVVVHHDATVPGAGPLVDLRLADVRNAAPQVVTLDEAAEVLEGMLIDIEIKNDPREPDHDPGHEMAAVISRWVAKSSRHDLIIVTSFNPGTVARIKSIDPQIATGLLVSERFSPDVVAGAASSGHEWILPDARRLWRKTRAVVSQAHDAGLRVCVWTVDAPSRLRAFRAAEVDAVITNDPGKALAIYGTG